MIQRRSGEGVIVSGSCWRSTCAISHHLPSQQLLRCHTRAFISCDCTFISSIKCFCGLSML